MQNNTNKDLAENNANLSRGQKIWKELDAKLPPAVAIIKNDEARVRKFADKVNHLPPTDRLCLIEWLQHEIAHCFDAHDTSYPGRKSARKKWQILNQHLKAIV